MDFSSKGKQKQWQPKLPQIWDNRYSILHLWMNRSFAETQIWAISKFRRIRLLLLSLFQGLSQSKFHMKWCNCFLPSFATSKSTLLQQQGYQALWGAGSRHQPFGSQAVSTAACEGLWLTLTAVDSVETTWKDTAHLLKCLTSEKHGADFHEVYCQSLHAKERNSKNTAEKVTSLVRH